MGLCKDCKFWRRGGYFVIENGEPVVRESNRTYGLCLHPKIRCDLVSDCLDRELPTEEDGDPPIDGVVATCDEYRAELEVGETFGCIHYHA